MDLKEKVLRAVSEHQVSTLMVLGLAKTGKEMTFISKEGEKVLKGEEAVKEHFKGIYRCTNGYNVSEEEIEKAYQIFREIFLK